MAEEYEPQCELLLDAVKNFQLEFGVQPDTAAYAPGRVNIIGEHTDYNDGYVMPMALPLMTIIVGKVNGLSRCRVKTMSKADKPNFTEFPIPSEGNLLPTKPKWANYVIGVCALFKEAAVPGFDAIIVSNVPLGGGLSSSASLEVCTYTFLENLTDHCSEDEKAKALICQKAENEFVGVPCGIMDQFITTMGKQGTVLLIDCRTLEAEEIPFDSSEIRVVIINSNVKHDLASGEYAKRKEECKNAAKLMEKDTLRDASLQDLHKLWKEKKMDKTIFRRAHHAMTETQRTIVAACCIRKSNFQSLGQLMYQSHKSLSSDYEVSCPELDELVEIARSVDGVMGSRMTGGGFGGCTITLVHRDAVEKLVKEINTRYSGTPTIYVVTPSDGAKGLCLEGFVNVL